MGLFSRFKLASKNNGTWSSIVFCFFVALLIIIDLVSKSLVFRICPHLWQLKVGLGLHCYINRYFAFGLPVRQDLMYAIYFFVITIALWGCFKKKTWSNGELLSAGFIISGALANIAERIFQGGVRDFIYIYGGVFNLADVYIIIGIVSLLFTGIITQKKQTHTYV